MMSNDHKGYYRTLGVNPGASDDKVEKYHRKLVKQCHQNDGGVELRTEAHVKLDIQG